MDILKCTELGYIGYKIHQKIKENKQMKAEEAETVAVNDQHSAGTRQKPEGDVVKLPQIQATNGVAKDLGQGGYRFKHLKGNERDALCFTIRSTLQHREVVTCVRTVLSYNSCVKLVFHRHTI